MCLRQQLAETNVKIIEIWPPLVQSKSSSPTLKETYSPTRQAELHDYFGERGRQIGMPVDQFTEQAYKGLTGGKELVLVGTLGPPDGSVVTSSALGELADKRNAIFLDLAKFLTRGS
jgi:hypothetical protein